MLRCLCFLLLYDCWQHSDHNVLRTTDWVIINISIMFFSYCLWWLFILLKCLCLNIALWVIGTLLYSFTQRARRRILRSLNFIVYIFRGLVIYASFGPTLVTLLVFVYLSWSDGQSGVMLSDVPEYYADNCTKPGQVNIKLCVDFKIILRLKKE